MSVLYICEQGVTLAKKNQNLLIEKQGRIIQWFHDFQIEQVIIVGNIYITPSAISFLLKKGIDTVFLSYYGNYKGRLSAELGKNIELRRIQFRKFEDGKFVLDAAKLFVKGKIENCRVLLRRFNRLTQHNEVNEIIHKLRWYIKKIDAAETLESLRGYEGQTAVLYFEGIRHLISSDEITFNKRTRRPPRDPFNAMLSLGYTFLVNAIRTAVNIAGLDPYYGTLHEVDYGRPSLTLDLMEEWRPVLVDSLVMNMVNRKIIRLKDFYFNEDSVVSGDGETEGLEKGDYPVLLNHEGMKKFVLYFEKGMNKVVFYPKTGSNLIYRDILLEQVRLFIRYMKGEEAYEPFTIR